MGALPANMPPIDVGTPAQPLVHPCLQTTQALVHQGTSGYVQ